MTSIEPLLFIGLALGLLFVTTRFTEGGTRVFTVSVLGVALLWGGLAARSTHLEKPSHGVALAPAEFGALGSGACRSCHPAEHVSWHRTFHRTMTELASTRTAKGPWAGVTVEADGRSIELSQRGNELWLRLPDPDLVAAASRNGVAAPSAGAPLVPRRVVLTTGSHHEQAYWVQGAHGELRLAPITYLIADRRYVARSDAFLQPPDATPHAMRWNSNCIQCHATRGEPRLDEPTNQFASTAVELGIACEACHGPGAAHVRAQQNPVTRFVAYLNDGRDPTIVNPARLDAARASEVCGQCHAYFVPRDEDRFWTRGYDYRPGDVLARTRELLEPHDARGLVEAAEESLFWADGTIRVGGREWNGLRRSACFLRGRGERQISCLSCHSMHDSEPDDQLRRGQSADAPCVKCHGDIAALGSKHTQHATGSAGASCVNCHMPYTSYALFKAIRSHRIDSPSAVATAEHGRPNACNLCHLDRTLAWTAEHVDAWYGRKPGRSAAENDAFGSTTARAVEELLAGDAATRAVVAAAFGRADAQAASGSDWEAAFLAELLDDPYAAVRKVAGGALATLPGYSDFPYDFAASAGQRREARQRGLERVAIRPRSGDPALPLDQDGRRDDTRVRALLAGRDQHPITISE